MLLAGCESADLAVDVHTDLAPGLEFDRIVLNVSGAGSRDVVVGPGDEVLDPGVRMPVLAVQPGRRRFAVQLFLTGRAEPILARSVEYEIRGSAVVDLWLVRRCRDVDCPPATDPSLTECDRGQCVAPDCNDSSCAPPECTSDGMCASLGLATCVVSACLEGRCVARPDDGRCGTGEVCDPASGCRGVATLDAGADAPEPDGDADAPIGTDAPVPPPYTLHFLPTGATTWQVVSTLGAGPASAVRAAFADPVNGELVVLTDTAVHYLRVSDRQWIGTDSRAVVFPTLEGTLLFEMEHVAGLADQHLFAMTRDGAHELDWTPSTHRSTETLFTPVAMFPPTWRSDVAPPYWEMYAMIGRTADPENWVTEDPRFSCSGLPVTGPHFTYFSWDGFGPAQVFVSVQDGACFDFVSRVTAETYLPLVLAGAPAVATIEAATDLGGLWLFTR